MRLLVPPSALSESRLRPARRSPEMASLGRWREMALLSVRGVRMAAVLPSILPIPSISSMKKYSTDHSWDTSMFFMASV